MRSLALVSLLALAALGSAQTVTLRFKPPVGTTRSYVTTTSMVQNVPGMPAPMTMSQTMPMTYRVVSRSGGLTTIQTKTGQVKVTVPAGSPMAAQKAQIERMASGMTSTMTVDEFGTLKSMGATGAPGASLANGIGAGMASGAQGISYPNKPLKVGDTWTGSLDMGKSMSKTVPMGMTAKGKIPIVYRLLGIEKQGGKTLARISMTMNGSTSMAMGAAGAGAGGGKSMSMTMRMASQGTMVVDAATGLLQSMSTKMSNDMAIMGQNMRQNISVSMKAL